MNEAEIRQTLQRATGIVEESKVPDDLRVVAFVKVWEALVGVPTAGPVGSVRRQPSSASDQESDALSKLANKVKVDLNHVQGAYEADNGTLKVIVAARKLPTKKSDATIELTLLACAGRQIISNAATPAVDVRQGGKAYSKFDSGNFATLVKQRDDLWIISGSGAKRALKLRNDAWEEVGAILRRLAGDKDGS
jgi:hypothetical protein